MECLVAGKLSEGGPVWYIKGCNVCCAKPIL